MASRGSAVRSVALLPISVRKSCVSSRQRAKRLNSHWTKTWLDDRLLYLADFLAEAAVAALPACTARYDT